MLMLTWKACVILASVKDILALPDVAFRHSFVCLLHLISPLSTSALLMHYWDFLNVYKILF